MTKTRGFQISIIVLEIAVLVALVLHFLGNRCTNSSKPFFCAHNNAAVPMLWTKDTATVSDKGWQYWIRLNGKLGDEVLQSMLKSDTNAIMTLFPNQPPIPHHSTCAVVGNSGNLLHSGYGATIDGHEAVFRMTVAPTKGFEVDVGTKTTYHLIYSSILFADSGIDQKAIILYYSNAFSDLKSFIDFMHDRKDRLKSPQDHILLDKVPPEHFRILHPDFWYSLQHDWLNHAGSHPSTGIMAIVIALRVCDHVDVFGFGTDKNGNWDHYYNKDHMAMRTDGVHNFDVEATIRDQLNREGSIRVYKGVR